MKVSRAAAGTAVFFVVAPALVAGVVPWALTMWEPGASADSDAAWVLPIRVLGGVVLLGSLVVLVSSFVRFVVEGRGTPAPVAPTESLVVGGWYRFVRNPMYVAVVGAILGQALLLLRPVLLGYGVLVWAVVAAFVKGYEEPTLLRTHGAAYEDYRRNVPAWLPRITPWRPPQDPRTG